MFEWSVFLTGLIVSLDYCGYSLLLVRLGRTESEFHLRVEGSIAQTGVHDVA